MLGLLHGNIRITVTAEGLKTRHLLIVIHEGLNLKRTEVENSKQGDGYREGLYESRYYSYDCG